MRLKLAATLAALLIVASIGAQAATLLPVNGVIFTRTGGQGFQRVTTPTPVEPGDIVMAAKDANAQIVVCPGTENVIEVGSGQVVTVPQCAPAAGAPTQGFDSTYIVIGA